MYEATSSDLLYLFDLDKDPNETVNLAQDERKVLKKLMKKVRTMIRLELPLNIHEVFTVPAQCKPRERLVPI